MRLLFAHDRFQWSFSSIDYDNEESRISHSINSSSHDSFFRGSPYTTVLLTSTASEYKRYDEPDITRRGSLMKYESVTSGNQLNATTFGHDSGTGLIFEVRDNPSLLQIHVTQSQSSLSIFAQTLALINGAVGVGALLLRWLATRCGTKKLSLSSSIASDMAHDEERSQPLLLQTTTS
jgi:hypothetical protein